MRQGAELGSVGLSSRHAVCMLGADLRKTDPFRPAGVTRRLRSRASHVYGSWHADDHTLGDETVSPEVVTTPKSANPARCL
jgi:hypothetical protein